MEAGLRRAIERQELQVYYQPIVEMSAGARRQARRVVGVEALLRWPHPERGIIPPSEFINVAEETGMIVAFGEWVLHTACAQTRAWQESGHPHLRVAVNISARQFRDQHLLDLIRTVLHETRLPPRTLMLEVTESTAMLNLDMTANLLGQLKAIGVQIALDDFGTGYSALAYLKRFPVDVLKIDRSFIAEISQAEEDAALASAIIALAETLKLRVVAEGVETEAQANFLITHGCRQLQGFLISPAVSAQEMATLLSPARPPRRKKLRP
jgi:EAL domain-containing protein (putative c-di-GMP-specific phosphodiesterase class I)